ncbi:MAG: ribulose-phosphate 3-epimerase [Melioribacteraceae bacterium]|nr:ribulose-phosphate 3-epimerase [Melioribacteraceae bacterium]
MKKIAPSILSADFSNLAQQIRSVEMAGIDWIHCDIMDGRFVPNITFGPLIVNAVSKITNATIDAHLMIEEPEKYIEAFAKAGADYITIHQEAVIHLHRIIEQIKALGVKAGVSINPGTPVSTLEEILQYVDMILIMSVNPGFGGQKLIESTLDKIEYLDRLREENGYKYLIQIDGGVTAKNIEKVSQKGCDIFVAGSTIFSSGNITASAMELKNLI